MDYYEELGIHPDATIGEIREAYKLAVRLVHPDTQLDPRLKNLAECQMKRLSDVMAVLVNPAERARYDAGLVTGTRSGRRALPAPSSGRELLQTAMGQWFWVLLVSMTVGTGVWYALAGGGEAAAVSAPVESPRAPSRPVATQDERPAAKKRPERIARKTDAGKADPAPQVGEMLPEEPQANVRGTPPVTLTPALTPILVTKAEPGAVPAEQNARQAEAVRNGDGSRYAGEWLYAADAREEDRAGTYPARYVELRLRETGQTLAGDYRAVHRMLDKAISAEVAFRVSGESPQGTTGKLEWESRAGAKGELELTLKSPDELRVRWWTTQFGKQEALSSGMAVLMRLKTR
jgi:DnaJ domain